MKSRSGYINIVVEDIIAIYETHFYGRSNGG
jgi:hypothetical protein